MTERDEEQLNLWIGRGIAILVAIVFVISVLYGCIP